MVSESQTIVAGETQSWSCIMSESQHFSCRLCGNESAERVLRIERSPSSISRLLESGELSQDTIHPLDVFQCNACSLVQLVDLMTGDFYDDYLMTTSHSPQMQHHQLGQARRFVRQFGLSEERVVDVGCGDGYFLECLRNAGAVPVGVEPSRRSRLAAETRGYEVHSGYVGAESTIGGAPYSGFTCRQVLEHVPHIGDFLTGVRRSLRKGAVGVVEVPSLEQAVEKGRFFDFFPDHVNYFSSRTLSLALECGGFEVIGIRRAMRGEYLEADVRTADPLSLSSIAEVAESLPAEIEEMLCQAAGAGKRVAMWGAGAKGIALLAVRGGKGFEYVIDSDHEKHGFFTPGSQVRIEAPDKLKTDPVEIVVISALAYLDEILTFLRDTIGFTGEVLAVGSRLESI